jgi:copper(I)-binding protein
MSFLSGLASVLAASVVSVPTPPGLPSTDVTAHHGTVYQTSDAGTPTQGFLEIQNVGAADQLTGANCPIADATSLVGPDGKPIESVAIPARQDVFLTANGPHLLLQNTHFSVQYGGIIPCSLTFASAGTVSVFLYATPAP